MEETIDIRCKDEDDMKLTKRLRSDSPSPTMFANMVRVTPEVLIVQEANEKMLTDEKHCVRLQKAAT